MRLQWKKLNRRAYCPSPRTVAYEWPMEPLRGFMGRSDYRFAYTNECISTRSRYYRHYDDILVGVDLWTRLKITLPPPPTRKRKTEIPTCGMTHGLADRTPEDERRLHKFLEEELGKFQGITGPTPVLSHQIRVKPHTIPIKQRYRPRNPAMQAIIDDEVAEMEKEGIIEPSSSAWSSSVVIVKKKNGKTRFCINFRKVNDPHNIWT